MEQIELLYEVIAYIQDDVEHGYRCADDIADDLKSWANELKMEEF